MWLKRERGNEREFPPGNGSQIVIWSHWAIWGEAKRGDMEGLKSSFTMESKEQIFNPEQEKKNWEKKS